MIVPKYTYTDKEIKELLSTIVIIVDTREKRNEPIINYFNAKGIDYKYKKLDHGDYSVMLPENHNLGIMRDTYYPISIERKNSIDELASTIKERTRFENELIRAQKSNFLLLVEDEGGYANLINGKYRSEYNARALLGSLKSFEIRYNFTSVYVSKTTAPNYIYHHLYYGVREALG